MEERNSRNNSKLRRILRLRWAWVIVGFGVLVALILILTPFGMDYEIESYFLANGADQTDVEDVDFNPFTRRLVVKNLIVKVGAEQVLKVSEADFTLSWSPFFKKRFLLEKVKLDNSTITMEEIPDGRWRIGGLLPTPSEDKSVASAWGFGLVELQIQNSLVKFRSAQLISELRVEQARLTRLRTWQPDQNTRLEFRGKLNDGKLQFKGDFSPFGRDSVVDGAIKLQGLTLTPFAQLMAADPSTLQGRLDADVRIQSKYSSETGFTFDQTGRLALKQASMHFGDVDLADENFTWDGTVQVKLPAASDAFQVAVAGQLEGQGGSVKPTPDKLSFQHSRLNWNGKFVLTQKPETTDFTVDGELKLQKFKIATTDLNLDEESLAWNGSVRVKIPNTPNKFQISATGQLEGKDGTANSTPDKLVIRHGALGWNGQFVLVGKAETSNFNLDGAIKLQKINMASPDMNLGEESLVWGGNVRITIPNSPDALLIAASGKMAGKWASLDSPSANFKLQGSGLNWNGEFGFAAKKEMTDIKLDGDLKFGKLEVATSDVLLAEEDLRWKGGLQILLPENSAVQRLMTNGNLESRRQTMALLRENLSLANENLSWKGRFNCGLKDFTAGLAAEGDFSLTDLAITATPQKMELLAAKAVNLKSIKGDADTQFNVATANITGLDLVGETGSPKKASLFSASELKIDTVKFERLKNLSIESARIVAAKALLHHKKDGRWLYIDDLNTFLTGSGASAQKKPSQNGAVEKAQPPAKEENVEFGIRIGSIEVVGDSVLHFEDETVSPTFRTDVHLKEARLADVNSLKPEQASPFTLEASSRKYTHLKLQGNVQPFTERISMDLKGNVSALEMPPLSPYAVKTIGYNLISGEMDGDINLKISVGQLEGEGDLKFYNPRIEAVNPEKFESEDGLPIPLQSALKVLREKNNDVHLKVPISGDVTDPKFSFSDAINQAVIKGLTVATLSYLKYTLGPYGTAIGIIELGVKVGEKVLPGIRLNPVEFQPGKAGLDEDATEYMQRLAQIMKDKPNLRIRLCGLAVESDRSSETKSKTAEPMGAQKEPILPLIDENLLDLAERRADQIEDLLVGKHGIKDTRIFICKPEIDKNPDAKPRVELVF
jgi:hypothetical protein